MTYRFVLILDIAGRVKSLEVHIASSIMRIALTGPVGLMCALIATQGIGSLLLMTASRLILILLLTTRR